MKTRCLKVEREDSVRFSLETFLDLTDKQAPGAPVKKQFNTGKAHLLASSRPGGAARARNRAHGVPTLLSALPIRQCPFQ